MKKMAKVYFGLRNKVGHYFLLEEDKHLVFHNKWKIFTNGRFMSVTGVRLKSGVKESKDGLGLEDFKNAQNILLSNDKMSSAAVNGPFVEVLVFQD